MYLLMHLLLHTLSNHDFEAMLQHIVPLHMFTYSKSVFDVITNCSSTEEKRLTINIPQVRKTYDLGEISKIGLIKSENNPAEAFSKVKACSAVKKVIYPNFSTFPVEQSVYHPNAITKDSKKG